MKKRAEQINPRQREKCMAHALEKMVFYVNRTPMERDRIEQEMEAALYRLALSNSELAVLNTMIEKISRSLDLSEVYQGVLKAARPRRGYAFST